MARGTMARGTMAADPSRSSVAFAIVARLGDAVVPAGAIGRLTTYRVGGCAAILVNARGVPDLEVVSEALAASGLPCLVVGKGSNLLVADGGFPGVAVILDPRGFGQVAVEGTSVRSGAAVALPTLAGRDRRSRIDRFRVGGGSAGIGGRRCADERRRPRFRHGVVLGGVRPGEARGSRCTGRVEDARWARIRLPDILDRSGRGGDGRRTPTVPRGSRDRSRSHTRDRAMATRAPTGRSKRRIGLHQPARRFSGATDRGRGI